MSDGTAVFCNLEEGPYQYAVYQSLSMADRSVWLSSGIYTAWDDNVGNRTLVTMYSLLDHGAVFPGKQCG
jgi:hypothetical protein